MMYTIEQLREIIKAELDKQEYVEEPYFFVRTDQIYYGRWGKATSACTDSDGV